MDAQFIHAAFALIVHGRDNLGDMNSRALGFSPFEKGFSSERMPAICIAAEPLAREALAELLHSFEKHVVELIGRDLPTLDELAREERKKLRIANSEELVLIFSQREKHSLEGAEACVLVCLLLKKFFALHGVPPVKVADVVSATVAGGAPASSDPPVVSAPDLLSTANGRAE